MKEQEIKNSEIKNPEVKKNLFDKEKPVLFTEKVIIEGKVFNRKVKRVFICSSDEVNPLKFERTYRRNLRNINKYDRDKVYRY